MGGCIAGLWCRNVAVLQSTEPEKLTSVRDAASFVMVPFSNRIGHGKLNWQGAHYSIHQNFAPEPHAIHGIGWERKWIVQTQSSTHAVLQLEHHSDNHWPFTFVAEQRIALQENTLKMDLKITNADQHLAPVGLGWHPYFVKREGARFSFTSTGRWGMGEDKLPTSKTACEGISQITDSMSVDHCFDGWIGSAVLEDAIHRCHIQSNLNRLVVYTHPRLQSIAIEPVSHVNNALQIATDKIMAEDLGLKTLEQGESFECSMQIKVEAR